LSFSAVRNLLPQNEHSKDYGKCFKLFDQNALM